MSPLRGVCRIRKSTEAMVALPLPGRLLAPINPVFDNADKHL
jgi:hypothetical protein